MHDWYFTIAVAIWLISITIKDVYDRYCKHKERMSGKFPEEKEEE